MSDTWCIVCFVVSVSPGVGQMVYKLFCRQCVTWSRTHGVQIVLSSVCHLMSDTWCTVCFVVSVSPGVLHMMYSLSIISVSPGVGHMVYSLFCRQCVTWCRTQGVQLVLYSVCHLVSDTWFTVSFIFSVSPRIGHMVYS